MTEAHVHELLDLIYGAATEPGGWPAMLRRLGEVTGSHNVVLTRQNELTGKGEGIRAEPNPDATRLYYGHFATRNVFLEADNACRAVKSYRPSVLTDEHKLPKSDLFRSEYYNDFLRMFDIDSVLILRLAVIGMDTVVLNLHRTRRGGQYGASELQLADMLLPHLMRAFEVNRKLAAPHLPAGGLAEVLDLSLHGLFVVDDVGRVLYANAAGETLLAGQGALRQMAGRLTTASAGLARRLEGLIAAATSDDAALRTGGAMTLRASEYGGPLAVSVTPASLDALSIFTGSRAAIVCVTDPETRQALPEQMLQDLYGLTPAETRVAAALFEGLDPAAVAEKLQLSIATVRAHLVHIFDKTGAHGQVKLARLFMRTLGAGMA